MYVGLPAPEHSSGGTGTTCWVKAGYVSVRILGFGWRSVFVLCSNTTPGDSMPTPSACSAGEAKISKPCSGMAGNGVKHVVCDCAYVGEVGKCGVLCGECCSLNKGDVGETVGEVKGVVGA